MFLHEKPQSRPHARPHSVLPAVLGVIAAVFLASLSGCSRSPLPEVVVYVAHDQIYSEPILRAFEARTGIRVKAAYDSETSKTTGLVQRLIAEATRPQADVFWNNEHAQTMRLREIGVLKKYTSPNAKTIPQAFKCPDGYWAGFGARARVIIYNTDHVSKPPDSVFDLVAPEWKGKVAIALPLFGTTATHAAALFEQLGPEAAKRFFRDLRANEVIVATGNSHVRDLVATGEALVGLTDTDDANCGVLDGKPVKWLFPDQQENGYGTLLIPNTVAIIKDGPNLEPAKQLVDFLLSTEIEIELAGSRASQIPLHEGLEAPNEILRLDGIRQIPIDFASMAARVPETMIFIREEFVR